MRVYSKHSLINGTGAGDVLPPANSEDKMSEKIPTWGYKGAEAKIFKLEPGEALPAGWSDSPVAVAVTLPEPDPEPIDTLVQVEPAPVAVVGDMSVETNIEPDATSELDALRAQAEGLGITVDNRWGVGKLKAKIAAQLAED